MTQTTKAREERAAKIAEALMPFLRTAEETAAYSDAGFTTVSISDIRALDRAWRGQ